MSIKSIFDKLIPKQNKKSVVKSATMTDKTEPTSEPKPTSIYQMPEEQVEPKASATAGGSGASSAASAKSGKQPHEHHLDFSTLQKLTIEGVKGKLTPIETSEYNNLLGQVNGELNTGATEEEIEKFKQRLEILHTKLSQ